MHLPRMAHDVSTRILLHTGAHALAVALSFKFKPPLLFAFRPSLPTEGRYRSAASSKLLWLSGTVALLNNRFHKVQQVPSRKSMLWPIMTNALPDAAEIVQRQTRCIS